MKEPPALANNPHPLELAQFLLWKFLQMPPGGLYAKWEDEAANAVWFYSEEKDYIFRKPRCDVVLWEEQDCARFRSLVFRFGSLADDGLCGFFEFKRDGLPSRRYGVHASFYPEQGLGLWIAITSREDTGPQPGQFRQ